MTNKEMYNLFNQQVLDKKYSELTEEEFLMWLDFKDGLRDN